MKLKFCFTLLILCLFGSFSIYGQDYRDTLNAARKAYNKGSYKQALKYYKSAERLAPKEVDLSQEVGQSAYKAGDFETAQRCFDKAASKSRSAKQRSRSHTNSGLSSMQREDYESTMESCKEALRNDPSNEDARQMLMEAKRLQKQKEEKQQQEQDKKDQKQDQQDGENQQQSGDGEEQKQDNQSQSSKSQDKKKDKSSDSKQQQEGTLEDRQTERKLDELSKQDLEAKRRMNGSNGSKQGKGSKNDW